MGINYQNFGRALVGVTLWLTTEICFGYAIKEFSLEEKVKRSDMVFIGRVVSITDSFCFMEHRCADVEISTVLKGKSKLVRVLWGGPISEFDPACCEVDKSYLFFLKRRKDNFFETVNAYHGVYELPKPQAGTRTP
jgi:hypothetical protein